MKKIISFLLIFTLLYLPILIGIDIYHGVDFYSAGTGQHVYFDVSGEPWSFESVSVNDNYLEIDNGADSERFIATVSGGECKFTIDVWDPDNTTGDATIASWTADTSDYISSYESHTTGGGSWSFYDGIWKAQTFTPSVSHVITSVELPLERHGTFGEVYVSIRATDADGHPTGSDFCSGSIDDLDVPTSMSWVEISFTNGVVLSANTKYAIVVHITDSDIDNNISWGYDSDATYSKGNIESSGDSGSTWSSWTGDDFHFKEYGVATSVSYQITNLQPSQSYAIYVDGSYDDSVTTDATGLFDWSGHALSFSHSIDVKYGVVGISVSNTTFEWGSTTRVPEGTYTSSQSTVITNTGNVAEDFNIKFSQLDDGHGNLMSLTGECAVIIEWSLDDTNWTAISDWDTYETIATGVAPNDSVTLYVRIKSPYSQECYSQYTYTSILNVQGVAS